MATHPSNKDPMAKIALVVALVLILAAVYVLVSSLIHTIGRNTTKGEIDTKTLVANNAAIVESVLKPIGEETTTDGSGTVATGPARSGEEVFNAVCQACHATGAAGAPKYDDKAAWEPRVAKGFDALMNTAINGKGAMPARGGQNVPDAELKAAIGFMTSHAGLHLDIPKDKPAAEAKPATTEKATEQKATEKPAEAATQTSDATPAAKSADAEVKAPQAPETPATPEAPAVSAEQDTAKAATTAPAVTANETATTETAAATPAPEANAAATANKTETASATPASESNTATSNATGENVYKATCFACHGLGVAGAPKIGDKTAWGPRIAKGKEVLYHSALNGVQTPTSVMPPRGGNFKLTDDEVKAAVDYMVSQAQ